MGFLDQSPQQGVPFIMTRKRFITLAAATLAASSLGAFGLASTQAGRPDCPGKIVCPLTGELVCKDRCPIDKERAATNGEALPACCRKPM